MKILQLTVHYAPNVGGVETHLSDLVDELIKRGNRIFVVTYRPLVSTANFKTIEKGKNFTILRIPWIRGLFYRFSGLGQFLYTFPGIFLATPFAIIIFNPQVIHAHGVVAGLCGVFWGKILGKRVVVSTHSMYEFPTHGIYRDIAKLVFKNANEVLTLSKQSRDEILALGVSKQNVTVFTYWVNLDKFKPLSPTITNTLRSKISHSRSFVVMFVGRLVSEKGLPELLSASKLWNKEIQLVIAGTGPMEEKIKEFDNDRILFLGKIKQEILPKYYNASDLVIVPSTHEEGFGRVIIESLACGTPVIGSKRGAIPEAMTDEVGSLISVSPKNIATSIEQYYKNRDLLRKKSHAARKFAERRYSTTNCDLILASYK